jgi:hypothetical protein
VTWKTKEVLDLSVSKTKLRSLPANATEETEYGELSHAKIVVVPEELKIVVVGNLRITVQLVHGVT